MASLKLPPAIQSVFDYARSVWRAPPSGDEYGKTNALPPRPAAEPTQPDSVAFVRKSLQQDRHRVFAHGDMIVTLAVHTQQARDADAPRSVEGKHLVVSATLESPSAAAGIGNRVTLSLAAISGLRKLFASAVGEKLIAWLDSLEHSSGVVESTATAVKDISGQIDRTSLQVEIRRQFTAIELQARQHWDDPDGLDAAYQTFNAKLLEWRNVFGEQWRTLLGSRWDGPAFFEEINKRAASLRQDRAKLAQGSTRVTRTEWEKYEDWQQRVQASWEDASGLAALVEEFRRHLPVWSAEFPVTWRGGRECERLSARISELRNAESPALPPTLGRQASQRGLRSVRGSLRGVPEWPHEAMATQAIALASDQFTYARGVLSYMGYRVGKVSTLTSERRRKILEYVFLGELPQVNDRQYMRTWGKPRTAARLRKLANAVAAFARNARKKRKKNMGQAIAEWEADLAYLKKRFYARRRRDWKWPETVRPSRA